MRDEKQGGDGFGRSRDSRGFEDNRKKGQEEGEA